jgi:hypothetical protein
MQLRRFLAGPTINGSVTDFRAGNLKLGTRSSRFRIDRSRCPAALTLRQLRVPSTVAVNASRMKKILSGTLLKKTKSPDPKVCLIFIRCDAA